jgi:small-conductance mechanosensitive channel
MNARLDETTASVQSMLDAFLARLPHLGVALLAFVLAVALARVVRSAVRRVASRSTRHRNLEVVAGRLVYGGVLLLGLLVALVIALPGFSPGQLVNLLGLSSVAIGFAFRDILQNFLAGILLLLQEPFRVGDQIVVKDLEGTVEDIQTRATYLRTYDGRRIVIPNSELFVNAVTVNTAYAQRRIDYDVGIGYGDDLANARNVLLEAVRSVPSVLRDPAPEVLVWEFGESSVMLRLRWWIAPPRRFEVVHARDAVLTQVRAAVLGAGIDLPFPTRQVLLHDQTESGDGDRRRQREGWPARPDGTSEPARIVDALRALGRRDAGGGGGPARPDSPSESRDRH